MNIILKTPQYTILLNVRDSKVSRDAKGNYHVGVLPRYQYVLKRTGEQAWLETSEHSINSEAFAQIMLAYTRWAEADAEVRGYRRAIDRLKAKSECERSRGNFGVVIGLNGAVAILEAA